MDASSKEDNCSQTMHSPLEIYMKDLLKGFCACALTDDNARLESVADANMILFHHDKHQDADIDKRERQDTHEGTLVRCACAEESSCDRYPSYYTTTQGNGRDEECCDETGKRLGDDSLSKYSNQRGQQSEFRSFDDTALGSTLVLERNAGIVKCSQDTMGRKLQRALSLPVDSERWGNQTTKMITLQKEVQLVKMTRSRMSSKKETYTKGRMNGQSPRSQEKRRPECNPRKLLDSATESAGSAPPSRPERKMSNDIVQSQNETEHILFTDATSQVALESVTMKKKCLPSNLSSFCDESLVTAHQESHSGSNSIAKTSPSEGSIIDSINHLWSTPMQVGSNCASSSLLSMAKKGTVPLTIISSFNAGGQKEIGEAQGHEND